MKLNKSLLKLKNHFVKRKVVYFFILIFLIYFSNFRILTSADNIPARYVPLSLLLEGDFYLDEFEILLNDREHVSHRNMPYYLMLTPRNHFISVFPPMRDLFPLPFYFALFFLGIDFSGFLPYLTKLTAAVLMSLSAIFIFLTSREITSEKNSFFVLIVFSFATSVWSVLSQDLWTHTVSVFFLVLSVYFIIKLLKDESYIFYAGFFLVLAFISRPPNVIFFIAFTTYVILYYSSGFKKYLLGTLPGLAFFFFYNFYNATTLSLFTVLGLSLLVLVLYYLLMIFIWKIMISVKKRKVLAFLFTLELIIVGFLFYKFIGGAFRYYLGYYANSFFATHAWKTPFLKGFLGLIVSPSRGLFFFSPVLILSLVGFFLVFKNYKNTNLRRFWVISFISTVVLIFLFSKYNYWHGGWVFGYRLTLETLPFLCLMLIPFIERSKDKILLKYLFGILLVISIFVQILGVYSYDYSWNIQKSNLCEGNFCDSDIFIFKNSQIYYYLSNPRFHYCYLSLDDFKIVCEEYHAKN